MARIKKFQDATSFLNAVPKMGAKQMEEQYGGQVSTQNNPILYKESFKDKVKGFGQKAGGFLANNSENIMAAAGSLMPLLMKKPDPNAKPYKQGTQKVKYLGGISSLLGGLGGASGGAGGLMGMLGGKGAGAAAGLASGASKAASLGSTLGKVGEVAGAAAQMMPKPKQQPAVAPVPAQQPANALAPLPQQPSYRKGGKLIKYQEGTEDLQGSKISQRAMKMIGEQPIEAEPMKTKQAMVKYKEEPSVRPEPQMVGNPNDMDFEKIKNIRPQDLLSRKDKMISKLPSFIQKNLAGKAKNRIDRFEKDYKTAKAELKYGDDLSDLDENRIARKIIKNRREAPLSGELEALATRGSYTPEQYPDTFERSKGRFNSIQEDAIKKLSKTVEPLETRKVSVASSASPALKMADVKNPGRIKYFDYTTAEAKGGYKRALESGQTDKDGNLLDPKTGLIYKKLASSSAKTVKGSSVKPTEEVKKEIPVSKSLPASTINYMPKKGPAQDFYTPGNLPIPKSREGAVSKNRLLKYIQSPEFLSLPKEEKSSKKVNALKLNKKDLGEYLNTLKNSPDVAKHYNKPEAPKAQNGKKAVKSYWDRVKTMQTERDPRAEYDYQKLAPWGKVKSEGVLDYASTLLGSPQKTVNYMLTGRYEKPIDTYNLGKTEKNKIKGGYKLAGDIATDPMMYPEVPYAAGKLLTRGAVKAAKTIVPPIVGAAAYLGKGAYTLGKKGLEKTAQLLKNVPIEDILEFGIANKGRVTQGLVHYNENPEEKAKREKGRQVFKVK